MVRLGNLGGLFNLSDFEICGTLPNICELLHDISSR